MEQKLTVVPMSGLGNRMRVVASVVTAANDIEGRIRLVWQSTWDCRARFSDLFVPLEEEQSADTESLSTVLASKKTASEGAKISSEQIKKTSESFQKDTDLFLPLSENRLTIENGDFRDRVATKRNLWLPLIYRRFHYGHEVRNFQPSGTPDLASMTRRWPSLYIATCYALAPYRPEILRRCFRPLPELCDHIAGMTSQYGRCTLGVHVRRTDNTTAIRRSPLSAFRQRIDRMIDSGMADTIFLSTDSTDVRRYFLETYGHRVLTRRIEVRRDTLQGMRDAVIDLWCLALTNRILGSFYSSFSEIAAELTGVPFEVATTSGTF